MKDFKGKYAVLSGGGSGMGREIAILLAKEGCHVAICDVSLQNMTETKSLCLKEAPKGTLVSTFIADVSNEEQVKEWAETVKKDFNTDHINLLFNNAGIAGGNSFVVDDRAVWDKVFSVDWGGVYFGTRTFFPMLMKSKEGHIINTSSIMGICASCGPDVAFTAYPTAKFAVRGFSESLQIDLALNAPHIKCSVVFPGHIGTNILTNTPSILGLNTHLKILSTEADELLDKEFRNNAPLTAREAAKIILDGVRENKWRIIVGKDAEIYDAMVRTNPEQAYTKEFNDELLKKPELKPWKMWRKEV